MTNILAIETSCDETVAAVVADGRAVRSSVVASQTQLHAKYGGVVPEIASRAHVEKIYPVIAEALAVAGVAGPELDAVAVANQPGLTIALVVSGGHTSLFECRTPLDLTPLGATIDDAAVEAEMTYPGEIQVTLLREVRCIEYAK